MYMCTYSVTQLRLTLCDPMDQPARLLCPWNFSKQEYWSGLPFSTPGDLPDPGIKPAFLASPVLAGGFFPTAPPGKSYSLSQRFNLLQFLLCNMYLYWLLPTIMLSHYCLESA